MKLSPALVEPTTAAAVIASIRRITTVAHYNVPAAILDDNSVHTKWSLAGQDRRNGASRPSAAVFMPF